jgi:hypothetical protein
VKAFLKAGVNAILILLVVAIQLVIGDGNVQIVGIIEAPITQIGIRSIRNRTENLTKDRTASPRRLDVGTCS